jgi:ACS family hexuronate transporter-like MFS transporter
MTTASAHSPLSRTHAWALTIVATLTLSVSYIDRQALAALAPTVTKELNISETDYGLLISAFSLSYLVGAPLAGALVDRIGARRGLLGAVLVWSIVAAMHALVPGFGVLFLLRIALGLAEAPSFPGAAQTVQRVLPPTERARGFGILFTGSSIGSMIAPPLAAYLENHYGFRYAFLGTAAAGLIWIPLWIACAWRAPAPAVLDTPKPSAEKSPGKLDLVRDPAVLRAALAIIASAPVIGFVINWSAKYLVAAHHLKQHQVGLYMALPPLLFDVGAILFGHFASVRKELHRDGAPDRPLFAGALVLALFVAATPFGRTPWESMILAGIGLAGGGGLFALLTSDCLARVHPAAVSAASGMLAAAQAIAHIISAPLLGKLIQSTDGYTLPFVLLGAWIIPGCVAWLIWKPRLTPSLAA